VIGVFAAPPPPPRAAFFAAPPPPQFEYYAPVGGCGGFAAKEPKPEPQQEPEVENPLAVEAEQLVEGLPDDVVHKITKQVEYYFSDINLATTEHLMRFISKDPEGYVPISVVAAFKKIKALVHNNSTLAMALRTSSKLVVSEDGKRVKRQEPFTEADLQELQSRIVVAENLPGDPSYQNLKKIFSAVASVISIRTCYPQTSNGTGPATNRSAKLDMLFANKLHAFVEYGMPEDAEKAILELNDEKNWRNGLRVRLLNTCTTKLAGKGKKGVPDLDGNGEEDVSTLNQSTEKQFDESSQLIDVLPEHLFDYNFTDKEVPRRGRGGRGRGRGYQQYNNNQYHQKNQHHQNNQYYNNRGGNNHVGTPPNQAIKHEQPPIGATKQPPGPRMPDGTRGFTMGRGKPQTMLPGLCAIGEA
jgi:La-related protein 7